MNTYRTAADANRDKADLTDLLAALDATATSIRRDDAGLWVLQGRRGYCATWGDKRTWALTVAISTSPPMSKLAWTWAKKRLAFAELTQDGEGEGVFRLHRLPTPAEAEEIRDIIGLRRRMELSPEELARRQEAGRRLSA